MKTNLLMSDLSAATAIGLGLCFFVIIGGMLIVKNYHDKWKL
jgi:hypothetical protein